MIADFICNNVGRRQWSNTLKSIESNCQTRIPYPARISFKDITKSKGKNRNFFRDTKAKRILHQQACIRKILKEVLEAEGNARWKYGSIQSN